MSQHAEESLQEMLRGPWVVECDDGDCEVVLASDNLGDGWKTVIATIGQEQLEIAHLIAAAPRLLAACEAALQIKDLWLPWVEMKGEHEEEGKALATMHRMFVEAVAKAKGEQSQ